MSASDAPVIRPFERADRDQLADLVNRHIRAVVPGGGATVHTVLAQLERESGEIVVDPWVSARQTLVAELRGSVVAATLLLRYDEHPDVGPAYRGAGELRWLVCAPDAPFQPGTEAAGLELARVAVERLRASGADPVLADGALPAPGVYGIPEQWPHVTRILEATGFATDLPEEWVHLAETARLADAGPSGLSFSRALGINGTRWTAYRPGESEPVGWIEVDASTGDVGRVAAGGGIADVGNLETVDPGDDATVRALLGEAARWLRRSGIGLLLAYSGPASADPEAGLLERAGFELLTRTRRGWRLGGTSAS